MTLTAIIFELERIGREYENGVIRRETYISELQRLGEQLFMLAGRLRVGKEG